MIKQFSSALLIALLILFSAPNPLIFAQAPDAGQSENTPANVEEGGGSEPAGEEQKASSDDSQENSQTDSQADSEENSENNSPENEQQTPPENTQENPEEQNTSNQSDSNPQDESEDTAGASATTSENPTNETGIESESASTTDDESGDGDDGSEGEDGTDPETASSMATSTEPDDITTVVEGTDAGGGNATSTDGGQTSTTTEGDVLIDTGDADSSGSTINTLNLSDTNVPTAGYGGDADGSGSSNSSGDDDDTDTVLLGETDENSASTTDDNTEVLFETTTAGTSSSSTVDTDNVATTSNDMAVLAGTGTNSASTTGSTTINTGDADAFGYLVSLFNIVVTNSQGGLIFLQNPLGPVLDLTSQIMGVFGSDENGEAVGCALLACTGLGSAFNILTDNIADIYNKLLVRAGTGGNAATSTGSTLIDTGEANAFGSIVNIGNLQIIDSRYLVILMNNQGDLEGDVVLPPPDFFKQLSTSALSNSNLHATSTNTAEIANNGTTTSDSGENTATATDTEDGLALVDTGDSDSDTFVLNDVNGNSIGGRPICFIVSVGGQWNGNVVGLPDGFSREETPFGEIICGAGEAERDHALPGNLNVDTTNYAKIFNEALVEAISGGNSGSGEDVTIRTGNANAFLQILNFVNQNIIGQDWIFALFTISGDWNGDLMFGSQEFWDEVNAQMNQIRSGGGPVALRLRDAELEITKTAEQTEITASSTVEYTVVVKNNGDPAYRSTLVDMLYDPEGNVIHRQEWELGTIQPNEEVTVEYTIFFNGDAAPGTYKNSAFVKGIERHPSIEKHLGNEIDSPVATAEIQVIGNLLTTETLVEANAVSGPVTCGTYLSEYLRFGDNNNPAEVMKLQKFLAEREGIDVVQTGIFDEATLAAVHAFQENHANDVLSPWGIAASTGFVYYTTQKAINEAMCEGADLFPLTDSQRSEIDGFKVRFDDYRFEDIPADELNEVGGEDLPALAEAGEKENASLADRLAEDTRTAAERVLAAVGTAGESASADSGTGGLWAKIGPFIEAALIDILAWVAQPFQVMYAAAFEK